MDTGIWTFSGSLPRDLTVSRQAALIDLPLTEVYNGLLPPGGYTLTFGEDSDYTINPPSYTDNNDNTITDNNTSLMWQKAEAGSKRWEDALKYCEGTNLAGHTDWRLPNTKELQSLVDTTRYDPAIDTRYFPDVMTGYNHYWTSTTVASKSASEAWFVSFTNGNVGTGVAKYSSDYVRCVRGEPRS